MEKSGVYELKCDECSAVYIGETGRKLNIRFHEHIDDFKKKRSNKSAFASHLLESGHSVDDLKEHHLCLRGCAREADFEDELE